MRYSNEDFGYHTPGSRRDQGFGFGISDIARVPGISIIPGAGTAIGIVKNIEMGESLLESVQKLGDGSACAQQAAKGALLSKGLNLLMTAAGMPTLLFNLLGMNSIFRCQQGRRDLSGILAAYFDRMSGGVIDVYLGHTGLGLNAPQILSTISYDSELAKSRRAKFADRIIDYISIGTSVEQAANAARGDVLTPKSEQSDYLVYSFRPEEAIKWDVGIDMAHDQDETSKPEEPLPPFYQVSNMMTYEQYQEAGKRIVAYGILKNKGSVTSVLSVWDKIYFTATVFLINQWFSGITKLRLKATLPEEYEKYAKESSKSLLTHEELVQKGINENAVLDEDKPDLSIWEETVEIAKKSGTASKAFAAASAAYFFLKMRRPA